MEVLTYLRKLFRFNRRWNYTPEMFLALVMEMQAKNNPVYSRKEVLRWGDVLQMVIKVNLSPYKDFADLLENGRPDMSIIEKISSNIE